MVSGSQGDDRKKSSFDHQVAGPLLCPWLQPRHSCFRWTHYILPSIRLVLFHCNECLLSLKHMETSQKTPSSFQINDLPDVLDLQRIDWIIIILMNQHPSPLINIFLKKRGCHAFSVFQQSSRPGVFCCYCLLSLRSHFIAPPYFLSLNHPCGIFASLFIFP